MKARPFSWGRHPILPQRIHELNSVFETIGEIPGSVLPYGNGRSYGDSCQIPFGTLLSTKRCNKLLDFDLEKGIIECEAGALLSQILDFVVPLGWFLPVVPGTKFVTVGGAVANDVHGKNHVHMGSFGCHVVELELRRSDGRVLKCSAHENTEWLRATIGGLGLTGLITRVKLRLRRVDGPFMRVLKRRFSGLPEFFELSDAYSHSEYTVAWIDSTATGRSLGRGIFSAADHCHDRTRKPHKQSQYRIPFPPKMALVNNLTTRAFNFGYMHKPLIGSILNAHDYHPFLFPLDGISNWNVIYGKSGFFQYQCVLPEENATQALIEILERARSAAAGSFLTVLKRLGSASSGGMLAFPRPGITFAIDFPNKGPKTLQLLDELDVVTVAAGGALYPAKDSRMSAATFSRSFPGLSKFRNYVDPKFSSGLWRRVHQ